MKRARELRPQDASAALYEGEALQKLGEFSAARDALEASLKLNPRQPADARIRLGQVYLALKDSKAAADQFEAAALVEPNRIDAHVGIAKALLAQEHFAEAVDELLPISKTPAANAEIFELLAEAYSHVGKPAEAQRARTRATELKKSSPKSAKSL